MSLKETIKEKYNLDLPISGGDGSSPEEAIVIESKNESPQEVQEAVLKHYFDLKELPWKQLQQKLVRANSKPMEVLKVAYLKNEQTYVMDWYFDLSKCDIVHHAH